MNPEIFREYDIRGIADSDLTSDVIELLGRGFAEIVAAQGLSSVAVGFDARKSSPRLRDALVRGLMSSGMQVYDLGLCPTPALYYSLHHLKVGAGVMITGSHNPSEFNGFKLCIGTETIHGERIQELRRVIERLETTEGARHDHGSVVTHPIVADFTAYLKSLFTAMQNQKMRVVLDSGNGTAGLVAPDVLRAMGCAVTELYSEPDGSFPNHHPDPTVPANLTSLIETVRSQQADIGIAFDGDSDRIGVVDESGRILWGDQLMVIFSRDILRERPGSTFVSEVKCSQVMYDDIRAHGGNAIMWKTGHSLIKAKMKEVGAAMAGEMSGHLFFADRYLGYDDAIYAACRIVEILAKLKATEGADAKMSSLLSDLPRTFNTPEIRFDCPDHVKFKVVEQARAVFLAGDTLPERPKEVITVDGVRAIFDHGWGLIRASNTQPVLVMRFEAENEARLAEIKRMVEQQVEGIIASLK